MRVLIVGAGPAGLCLAAHLRRSSPSCRVEIIEQRGEAESAGLGITLPTDVADRLNLKASQRCQLDRSCIRYREASYLQAPTSLVAVARDAVIAALRRECESSGVHIRFDCRLGAITEVLGEGFDLIVGADGVHSVVRRDLEQQFGSSIRHVNLYHGWFETLKRFDRSLTMIFQEYSGSLFTGWGYQFSESRSTVIVQASATALESAHLYGLKPAATAERLSDIFKTALDGHPLIASVPYQWSQFALLKNRTWHTGNVVLIGDAAHTAHFCRGFGTADALYDADCLSKHISASSNLCLSLEAFQRERAPEIALHMSLALSGNNWQERIVKRREKGEVSAIIEAISDPAIFTPETPAVTRISV